MTSRDMPPTRRGYDAREVVSSLQKAIRRSRPHEALYWALELDRSGYSNWCFKRIKIIASEDVGLAEPGIAAEIRALYENWVEDRQKKGDGALFLTHAVLRLATAKKSRLVDWALVYQASPHVRRLEVADEALDVHTLRGKQMGRGMEHFIDEASELRPFEGDIDELSDRYRDLFRRVTEEDSSLPDNPWSTSPSGRTMEPAQKGETVSSGQLPSKSGGVGQLSLSADRTENG